LLRERIDLGESVGIREEEDDDNDDGGGGGGIPQRLCGRDDAEDPATDPMVLIPTGDVCFMNRVDPELDEARGF